MNNEERQRNEPQNERERERDEEIERGEQAEAAQHKLVYYQIPEMSFEVPRTMSALCVRECVCLCLCVCVRCVFQCFGLSK